MLEKGRRLANSMMCEILHKAEKKKSPDSLLGKGSGLFQLLLRCIM
ncbi:hypothetical protein FH5_03706 [Priestia endophytica]|nr:hypothetical protein FH5_03706 [Priestia endophytica]